MIFMMGNKILVNGEETCNYLLKFCSEELKTICNYVAAPQLGEVVDVTSHTSILDVKLSDSLMNSIRFEKVIYTSHLFVTLINDVLDERI